MRALCLPLLFASAVFAQDLPVIHLPADAAQALQQAFERKQEAIYIYEQLERLAIMTYATRPGGGTSGRSKVITSDPLSGWQFGARFSQDFAAMIPRFKPEASQAACLQAVEKDTKANDDIDTIPIIPWLK